MADFSKRMKCQRLRFSQEYWLLRRAVVVDAAVRRPWPAQSRIPRVELLANADRRRTRRKSNSQFHVEPLAQVKHTVFHTFGGIGRYEMPTYERRSPADFSESAAFV